ncbi:hypothetical protein NHP21005_15970 [Helicobacter sp. NHP21005]|uniref:hypothetical protein n=1 Tax=Helicobacter felistomachi TaxID=3040201 RepID=UPI00257387B8|nr:hypothetical protein [Helicobacter sp. NHP21005]BEG57909.1 hypothetical protein NHP21005_15970 [Helicobacter sp. NHP21005]
MSHYQEAQAKQDYGVRLVPPQESHTSQEPKDPQEPEPLPHLVPKDPPTPTTPTRAPKQSPQFAFRPIRPQGFTRATPRLAKT